MILSLALVAGCKDKNPGQTTPPENGGDATAQTDKPGKKPKDKGGDKNPDKGQPDEEDPTKKVCPAEVGEYPAPFFGDSILIRLPKGVTEENLVEFQPGFARLSVPIVESVSCVKDVPGANISFMALVMFEDDPAKTIIQLRDETLAPMGYTNSTFSDEKLDEKARTYEVVIDRPADEANGLPDPGKALLVMKAAHGRMHVLLMETHPMAWNALKETFRESATRMTLRNPE
ncbi:MAG: hypothetical protein HC927_12980 [Deltaproteobacteria bacterium]|nr:hypothetical protein [Deltaproteobacteria bacterium]